MAKAGNRAEEPQAKLRVAFCHPDLGIGGAERLVVDAAAELASRGHEVQVFTTHHDPSRCFPETVGGTFPVIVYGDFLPRHIFRRLHALFAYLRCLWLALCMLLFHARSFDVVFVDQVSAVVPVLKLNWRMKVLFYCHFPDLLLAEHGTKWSLRSLYRAPIDWLEETTTGMADAVVVNSKFTAATFAQTFTRLAARGLAPAVLYPAVALPTLGSGATSAGEEGLSVVPPGPFFLSLNRYERKKTIETAILATGLLAKQRLNTPRTTRARAQGSAPEPSLVVAGGYDARLLENVEYAQELKALAREEGIAERVLFLKSISDASKAALLRHCTAVLYTPEREHFGLVPIEAMSYGVPVVACNSGGPTESIVDGKTGFLCEPSAVSFAVAMAALLHDPPRREAMGAAARRRVEFMFSRQAFGNNLESILRGL